MEEINVSTDVVRYLRGTGIARRLERSLGVTLKFTTSRGDMHLHIQGNQEKVNLGRSQLQVIIDRGITSTTTLPYNLTLTLRNEDPAHIVKQFHENSICVGWHVDLANSQLRLFSDSAEGLSKGLAILFEIAGGATNNRCQPNLLKQINLAPGGIRTSDRRQETPGSKITSTLDGLKMETLRYLRASNVVRDMRVTFKVGINVDKNGSRIIIEGEKNRVEAALSELRDRIDCFCVKEITRSPEFIACLRGLADNKIVSTLKHGKVTAGWDIREQSLYLCSEGNPQVVKAAEAICDLISEGQYPQTGKLEATQMNAVGSSGWLELTNTLTQSYHSIQFRHDKQHSIVYFAVILKDLSHKEAILISLEAFFQPLSLKKITIPFQSHILDYVNTYQRSIKRECQKSMETPVTFEISGLSCILNSTSQKAVDHAASYIRDRFNSITTKPSYIMWSAHVNWLKSEEGGSGLAAILLKTQTVCHQFTIDPNQLAATSATVGTLPSMRAATASNHDPTFELLSGDLTMTCLETLREEILTALQCFTKEDADIIAFPAVGTGRLKYDPTNVGNVIVDTVTQYMRRDTSCAFKKIYLVIHPDDKYCYELFSNKLKKMYSQQAATPNMQAIPFKRLSLRFQGTESMCLKAVEGLEKELQKLIGKDDWTDSPNRKCITKLKAKQRQTIQKYAAERDVKLDFIDDNITMQGDRDDMKTLRNMIDKILIQFIETKEPLPINWDMSQMSAGYAQVTLNQHQHKEEYQNLSQAFYDTADDAYNNLVTIDEIIRIQNEHLYMQYTMQKKKVTNEVKDSTLVERLLWHGTDATTVFQICRQEFNRSFCGRNGVAYGQGSYFSTSSAYSMKYAQGPREKYMILAKVITGWYCLGNSSTDRKNLKPGYHSTVDRTSNPNIFVVYHDAAAYPAYVIKFRFPH